MPYMEVFDFTASKHLPYQVRACVIDGNFLQAAQRSFDLNPGGGVLPIMDYTGRGEAPPERGPFFRLEVCERVGISRVEVYQRVGISRVNDIIVWLTSLLVMLDDFW